MSVFYLLFGSVTINFGPNVDGTAYQFILKSVLDPKFTGSVPSSAERPVIRPIRIQRLNQTLRLLFFYFFHSLLTVDHTRMLKHINLLLFKTFCFPHVFEFLVGIYTFSSA